MEEQSEEPVMVFVRIRPEMAPSSTLSSKQTTLSASTSLSGSWSSFSPHMTSSVINPIISDGPRCIFQVDEKTVRVVAPDSALQTRKSVSAIDDKIYTFDKIFPDTSGQEDIYRSVSSLVKATVRGYNTTIFAYGCTGSGKSYTMTGNGSAPGIIPRAISEIFSIIEETATQEKDVFFYVRISYVELYNNNFRNLLEFASKELANKDTEKKETSIVEPEASYMDSTSASMGHQVQPPGSAFRGDKIEVRESQSAGVFLAGQYLRIPVTTAKEAFQLINKGNKYRATGSTNCNDESSRSHAILTIHVESRAPSASDTSKGGSNAELRLGKMHLVDLAGSERVALSGAEGSTLVETQNINLSLTALGDVLSALSKNATILSQAKSSGAQKPASLVPVPYRNSKLTHLLKDSLGGNSKTIMITNIRNLPDYYQQTLISLMYASRAKKVKNRSLINRNVIGDTGIMAVTTEIERLKTRLEERQREFESLRHLQLQDAHEKSTLKNRLEELTKANELEKKQLETQMSHIIHSQAGQLAMQREKIISLQSSLQDELIISQNRIVEQEREINWLKKELEESSKFNKPSEDIQRQIEKLTELLSISRSDANKLRNDLSLTIQENDSLKAQLIITQTNMKSLENQNKLLTEKLSDKSNEVQTLTNTLTSTTNTLQLLSTDKIKLTSELTMIQDKYSKLLSELNSKTHDNDHNHELIQSLESQLNLQSIELKRYQSQLKSLTESTSEKITLLETEKKELKNKLNTTVTILEKKTSSTIDEATNKLKLTEEQLKLSNEKIQHQQTIIQKLETEMKQCQQQDENKFRSLNETNNTLQEEINRLSSQLQTERQRLTENQNQLKLTLDQLNLTKQQQDEILRKHDNETKQKINQLTLQHQDEIQSLQSQWNQSIEMKIELMKSKYEQQIHVLQDQLVNQSNQYQMDLKQYEQKLIKDKETEYTKRLQIIQEEYLLSLTKLKQESDEKYQSLYQTKDKEYDMMLDQKIQSLLITHQQELTRQKQQLELSTRNQLDILRNELEMKYMNEIKTYQNQMKSLELQSQQDLLQLKATHQKELDHTLDTVLKNSIHSAVEKAVNLALNEQKNELTQQHNRNIEEIKIESKQEIERLKEELQNNELNHQEQLKQANNKLKLHLESKYREKLKQVSDQNQQTNEQFEILLKETETRLKNELISALDYQKQQSEQQIQDIQMKLREQYDQDLIQVREELEMNHQNRIQQLQNEHLEQERLLRDSLEQAQRQSIDWVIKEHQIRDEIVQQYQIKENSVKSNYEKRLEDQRYEYEQAKSILEQQIHIEQEKYQLALQTKERNFKDQYEDEKKRLIEEYESILRERDENYVLKIQEQSRDLHNQFQLKYNELEKEYQTRYDEAMLETQISHQKELDSLKQSLQRDYEESLKQTNSSLTAQLENDNEIKLKTLLSELQSQILNTQSFPSTIATQFNFDNSSIFDDVPNLTNAVFDPTKPSFIKSFQQTWQKKINELNEQYQESLQQQRMLLLNESEHNRELMNREMQLLRNQYNDLLSSSTTKQSQESIKLRELQDENHRLLESFQDRDQHYQSLVKSLEENMKSEKQYYNQIIEKLKQQYDDDRIALLKQHEDELIQRDQSARDRLEQELSDAKDSLTHQHNLHIQEVIAKYSKLQSEQSLEKSNLEHKLSSIDLDMNIMKQEHELTLQRLKSTLENEKRLEIEKLRHDLLSVDSHAKRELMTKEEQYQEELNKLHTNHQKTINDIHQKHQMELKELEIKLERKHESKYQEKQTQLIQDFLTKQKTLETKIKTLEQEHKATSIALQGKVNEIQILTQQNQDQSNSIQNLLQKHCEYEEKIERLSNQYHQHIQELNQSHLDTQSENDESMNRVRQEYEYNIKKLQSQHEDELNRMKEDLETKYEFQIKVYEQESQRLREQLKEEIRLEYDTKIDNLTKSYDEQIQSLESSLTTLQQDHENELNELRCNHETELEKLKQDHSLAQMMEIFVMKQQLQNEYELKINQLEDVWNNKKSEYESLINQLKQQMNEVLDNLKQEYDQEYSIKQQESINEIVSKHNQQLNEKEMEYNIKYETLEREYHQQQEQSIEELTKQYEELIRAIRQQALQDSDTNLHYLQQENIGLQGLLDHTKEQIKELQSSLDRTIQMHAIEYDTIQKQKEDELETLKSSLMNQYESKLQEKEQEIESLKESNRMELNRIKLEYQTEYEFKYLAIQREYEQQIESLNDQLSQSQQRYDNDTTIYQKHSDELIQKYSDLDINNQLLHQSNESLQNQVKDLSQQLQNQQENYDKEINNLKQAYRQEFKKKLYKYKENELTKLHQQHDQELIDVRNEIERLHMKVDSLLSEKNELQKNYEELKTNSMKKEISMKESELLLKTALVDREKSYQDDLKRALSVQQHELQGDYLNLLQSQVNNIMKLVQSQTMNIPNIQVAQEEFMKTLQRLPEIWKEKYQINVIPSIPNNNQSSKEALNDHRKKENETVNDIDGGDDQSYQSTQSIKSYVENLKPIPSKPISSSSSSHADRLISAILDGDIQGIRSIVRSKGEDLQSDYWKDIAKSLLPVHRAISGLHFHGSDKVLLGTIKCLYQLGVDVNLTDQTGNTALHKAIQICTSKSVCDVIQCLLVRGADPNIKNKDGDTPLHSECRRIRSASAEVIESLLRAQANPNQLCSSLSREGSVTALTLILQKGSEVAFLSKPAKIVSNSKHLNDLWTPNPSSHKPESPPSDEKLRISGKRVWIQAAEILIKSGASWSNQWRDGKGWTQLHHLMSAFPGEGVSSASPSQATNQSENHHSSYRKDDYQAYRHLVQSALEYGQFDIYAEDTKGRNILFVLCERLAEISIDHCPSDYPVKIIELFMNHPSYRGLGGADREGKTIFDIHEQIEGSCFNQCRNLLVTTVNDNKEKNMKRSSKRSIGNPSRNEGGNVREDEIQSNINHKLSTQSNYERKESMTERLNGRYGSMDPSDGYSDSVYASNPPLTGSAAINPYSSGHNGMKTPSRRYNESSNQNYLFTPDSLDWKTERR